MQIHEISTIKKNKKRIGRGGKRGTYSGRGMKGQKSRSGGNVDPLFEGGRTTLIQKMKKNRGFKSPHAKKITLTLAKLEIAYNDGDTVSVQTLMKKKILRTKTIRNGVRIVATGKLTKKLMIDKYIGVTALAKEQIEKKGGKINVVKKSKKANNDKK